MKFRFVDAKPQVGIFEIVDDILLLDTEDVQPISHSGDFFDGLHTHLHEQDVKTLVKYNSSISEKTKELFASNRYAYLNYPRGRVDYNTKTKKYHIMASKKFFTTPNIERITRAFHLPPFGTANVVLEVDEVHYGY